MFNFKLCFKFWPRCLRYSKNKDFNLIQTAEESKVVVDKLQRKCDSTGDSYQMLNSVVNDADDVDVVPPMKRLF